MDTANIKSKEKKEKKETTKETTKDQKKGDKTETDILFETSIIEDCKELNRTVLINSDIDPEKDFDVCSLPSDVLFEYLIENYVDSAAFPLSNRIVFKELIVTFKKICIIYQKSDRANGYQMSQDIVNIEKLSTSQVFETVEREYRIVMTSIEKTLGAKKKSVLSDEDESDYIDDIIETDEDLEKFRNKFKNLFENIVEDYKWLNISRSTLEEALRNLAVIDNSIRSKFSTIRRTDYTFLSTLPPLAESVKKQKKTKREKLSETNEQNDKGPVKTKQKKRTEAEPEAEFVKTNAGEVPEDAQVMFDKKEIERKLEAELAKKDAGEVPEDAQVMFDKFKERERILFVYYTKRMIVCEKLIKANGYSQMLEKTIRAANDNQKRLMNDKKDKRTLVEKLLEENEKVEDLQKYTLENLRDFCEQMLFVKELDEIFKKMNIEIELVFPHISLYKFRQTNQSEHEALEKFVDQGAQVLSTHINELSKVFQLDPIVVNLDLQLFQKALLVQSLIALTFSGVEKTLSGRQDSVLSIPVWFTF